MTKKAKDTAQMDLFQGASSPDESKATSESTSSINFEATLLELEKIVTELDGEVQLERALKLFDMGMKLSYECQKFLQSAEQQVELLKKNADGTFSTSALDEDDEEV